MKKPRRSGVELCLQFADDLLPALAQEREELLLRQGVGFLALGQRSDAHPEVVSERGGHLRRGFLTGLVAVEEHGQGTKGRAVLPQEGGLVRTGENLRQHVR